MIVPDSPKSETSGQHGSARIPTSPGQVDTSLNPPPYSATIASGDEYRSGNSPNSNNLPTTSSVQPNLPPRCNHFLDRKVFSGLNGTWHVDTTLVIPERLLLPAPQFDGYWNREAQKTRKTRVDESKRCQELAFDSKRASPLPPVETRPNLMLATTNGAINGDIHIMSSDGVVRQTTLVAQGFNGSINLKIHAPPDQPLRVFASTTNGSINIKIPSSFEGAVIMSTTWGTVNISEPIKAKLTTFSSASNTTRAFVGDWQAQGFGTTANSTELVDGPSRLGQRDPFTIWNGPFVEISTTNGSVSLSHTEEGVLSAYIDQFTKAIQGFKDSWFGGVKYGANQVGSNPQAPIPPTPRTSLPGTRSMDSKNPPNSPCPGPFGSG